jgi:type 1 fimbriae regulatory protein FimB
MRKIRGKRPISTRAGQSTQSDSLKPQRTRRAYSLSHDSQYLTASEIKAVFAVMKRSPRETAIFRLMLHRGLRAAEPGLLQLEDWQPRDGVLFVRREKGSESRAHQLLPVEVSALNAWLKIRGSEPGPLFASRQKRAGGLGIHRNQLDRLWRRYCQEAGVMLVKRHLHVLKHTTATTLADRGTPPDLIQDWLSHKSLTSTARYLHPSARRRAEAYALNRDWR